MQWIKKSSQQVNLKPINPIKNNAVFIMYIINEKLVKTKFMGEYKEPHDAIPVSINYTMNEQNNLGKTIVNFDGQFTQLDTLYKIQMLDGQIQAFINRSNGLLEHYVFEQ